MGVSNIMYDINVDEDFGNSLNKEDEILASNIDMGASNIQLDQNFEENLENPIENEMIEIVVEENEYEEVIEAVIEELSPDGDIKILCDLDNIPDELKNDAMNLELAKFESTDGIIENEEDYGLCILESMGKSCADLDNLSDCGIDSPLEIPGQSNRENSISMGIEMPYLVGDYCQDHEALVDLDKSMA